MAKALDLPYPPRWINAYLFDKLSEYEDIGVDATQNYVPIFAASPTNLEDIYQGVVQSTGISEPLVIQYDRMINYRPNPFYPHKREQTLYYLYSTSLENVNNATSVISQILDRGDVAGQELNLWAARNPQYVNGRQMPFNVFFRTVKVYQTSESGDVMNAVSARKIYVNKLVIEYDYHARNDSTFK